MLNVVDSPVYLCRPIIPAEMSVDQLRLAADQLRDFALGELAFIERELAEIRPLRADTFTDHERKQTKLAEMQAQKWRWLGLSLGLLDYVEQAWPWGYLECSIEDSTAYAADTSNAVNDSDGWIACEGWREMVPGMAEERVSYLKCRNKELPGVNGLAQYIEGEFIERKLLSEKGKKLKWPYIKHYLPKGITERSLNGRPVIKNLPKNN